jgi:hypothetical protein
MAIAATVSINIIADEQHTPNPMYRTEGEKEDIII